MVRYHLLLNSLPCRHRPSCGTKQWMRLRFRDSTHMREEPGTAHLQFAEQVAPLVRNLPGCCRDLNGTSNWTNLFAIEGVSPRLRLFKHRDQICIDGGARRRMRAKTHQLRMVTIANGLAAQDCARQ